MITLYEVLIAPKPASAAPGGFVTGDWISRFEFRRLDDSRALGRNSVEEDRAFATAARVSELPFLPPTVRVRYGQRTDGGAIAPPQPTAS
jgi:hypothetical protein